MQTLRSLVVVGALALSRAAAAQSLPTAQQIFQAHLQAIGGADAVRAQKGRHAIGTLEIPSQGISGRMEMWMSPPLRLLAVSTIGGFGEVRSGYDGETAWSIHPATGPTILSAAQRAQMVEQADLLYPLHLDRYVASAETVGQTQCEGKPCYRVKITTPTGETYHSLFDVASGLMVGSERTIVSPMGSVDTYTAITDYRSVDGVKVPAKFVQRLMGIEQIVTLSEVVAGTVDSALFALPKEIKALKQPS